MKEIWKDIEGYEGLYQVSNLARFKRVDRQYIMKYSIALYPMIQLSKNGKRTSLYVHRLLAQAFIPNPNNYPCINHKDEIKENVNLDNLEWCTQKYNANYGTAKEKQLRPVIQKTKYGEIVKTHKSVAQAFRETGTSMGNICSCVYGNRKYAGGFMWERKDTI